MENNRLRSGALEEFRLAHLGAIQPVFMIAVVMLDSRAIRPVAHTLAKPFPLAGRQDNSRAIQAMQAAVLPIFDSPIAMNHCRAVNAVKRAMVIPSLIAIVANDSRATITMQMALLVGEGLTTIGCAGIFL